MQRTRTRPNDDLRRDLAVHSELGLTVVHHPDVHMIGVRRVLPADAELMLGRGDDCSLPGAFEDELVSRRHARVWRADERVMVEDLQSRNGTWLDGQRIVRAALTEGALLTLGDVSLMLTRAPLSHQPPRHPELVGIGAGIAGVLAEARRAAPHESTVLLLGEMGTGKELVTRAIHHWSARPGELIAVNCAGISEQLLLAELFGHQRGAFTGARDSRPGLVGRARAGTLFLDEIADAPANVQVALLRLLETGHYRPVGADQEVDADVRVIVGAQPRLVDAVDSGTFRADLWGRIARLVIELPPLAERREDVPTLAAHFAMTMAGRPVRLTSELVVALVQRPWPGNVRELRATIERGIVASDGTPSQLDVGAWLETDPRRHARDLGASWLPVGTSAHLGEQPVLGLPADARRDALAKRPTPARGATRRGPTPRPDADALRRQLADHGGNVAAAARQLGVERKTFYRWCQAAGIDLASARKA